MKITIDTKQDSHEEIKKVLHILTSLVEEKEIISNDGDIFSDDNNQEKSSDMFSMFSSSNSPSPENKTEEETTEEEKKEEPKDADIDLSELEEYD